MMKIIYYGISVAGEENSQEQRHISSMEVLDVRGMHTQIHQKYSQITMSSPIFSSYHKCLQGVFFFFEVIEI